MKLTNQQIYNASLKLNSFSVEGKIPVKINFFLQKNIQIVIEAGKEIEKARIQIIQELGELNAENNVFMIPKNNMAEAQKELEDLFTLEQELNIHLFKLDDFQDIALTYDQLSAIMFMIEE